MTDDRPKPGLSPGFVLGCAVALVVELAVAALIVLAVILLTR